MSIEISDVSATRKQCVIVYPFDEFLKDYQQKVRTFRGQIPGFRPGKVPKQVVEKKCGLGFRQELVDQKMRKAWEEIYKQCQPLGNPDIVINPENLFDISMTEHSDITLTMSFDVPPTITPFELSQWGLTLESIKAVSSDEAQKYMTYLSRRYGTEVEKDAAAQAGDLVHVDMTYIKENKTESDLSLTLDAEEIHPEFVKQLVGKKAGDELEFEYTPIEYGKKGHKHAHDHDHSNCSGHDHDHCHDEQQPLAVKVLVKKVSEVELAAAEKIYAEMSQDKEFSQEKFDEMIQAQLKQTAYKNHFRDNEPKVMEHLLTLHNIEIPGAHFQGQHFQSEQEKADFEKSVRHDYLLQSYGHFLKVQVPQSDINFFADIFCEESNIPPMFFQYFVRSDKKFQQQFQSMVMQRAVVKAIVDGLTPSEAVSVESAEKKPASKKAKAVSGKTEDAAKK